MCMYVCRYVFFFWKTCYAVHSPFYLMFGMLVAAKVSLAPYIILALSRNEHFLHAKRSIAEREREREREQIKLYRSLGGLGPAYLIYKHTYTLNYMSTEFE